MEIPFALTPGTVIDHDDHGLLHFVEAVGGYLRFEDQEGELFELDSTDDLGRTLPHWRWLLAEFNAGRCREDRGNGADRNTRYLLFDRSAAFARDRKSVWRFEWAMAAMGADLPLTEAVVATWIKAKTTALPNFSDDELRVLKGTAKCRPGARSLMRWMDKLSRNKLRIGCLVNQSGREEGFSQLPPITSRLVDKHVLGYWGGVSNLKTDAASLAVADWDILEEASVENIGNQPPCLETVRKRINKFQRRMTELAKYGKAHADRRYKAAGEPLPVGAFLDRVYLDGKKFRHAVVFSTDWTVPAAKMKIVAAMDAATQYVFPFKAFCGPFRPEMTMGTLLNVMTPPQITEELQEADQWRLCAYGQPAVVMPDNEKAIVPPGYTPGLTCAISAFALPPIYSPNAKSELENFFRVLSLWLDDLPGKIVGPRIGKDPRHDPIASAEVTMRQYAARAEACRLWWNSKPKSSLGGKSPDTLVKYYVETCGPRLVDPREVRRLLSRTPKKQQVLTTNGLTYDNVHYRFAAEAVEKMLDEGAHKLPFAQRLKGTGKCLVTIRVWDDDIDKIEVFDGKDYHVMYSTDPAYTGGLSRFEHREYHKMLRAGKDGAVKNVDKLRQRAEHLRGRHDDMPKQAFRARENTAALIQHEEIRAAAGQRGADPLFGQVPELASLTNHAGHDRVDAPAPPPQSAPRAKPQPRGYAPPKRDPDFGTASTAHLTRPNMIDERSESSEAPQTRRSRWDFDDEGENDGQQPVAENSGQVPRQVAPNSPSAPRAGAASTTNDVLPTEHAGDDVGDDDEPNEDGFDEDYGFDRTRDDDEDEKDDD